MEELNWRQSPWGSFVWTILIALCGIAAGYSIGLYFASLWAGDSSPEFFLRLAFPIDYPELKTPVFIVQGCATLLGFIIFPILYIHFIERIKFSAFFKKGSITILTYLVTIGIVIFFSGFNSIVIEWNAGIHLPESLKYFTDLARRNEDLATETTKFLTQFDTPFQFIRGLIVIAVFAGIGEELIFRGLLQPSIHRITKNIHVAIWVSAVLFSALHMQFFGFVPRLLLGALFGYLYYWSGNLAVPMFAHFINNAFLVTAIYMVQKGMTNVDLESPKAMPWSIVITSTICAALLTYYFKKQFTSKPTPLA